MDGKGWTTETDGETEKLSFVFILFYSLIKDFRIMIGNGKLGLSPFSSLSVGIVYPYFKYLCSRQVLLRKQKFQFKTVMLQFHRYAG